MSCAHSQNGNGSCLWCDYEKLHKENVSLRAELDAAVKRGEQWKENAILLRNSLFRGDLTYEDAKEQHSKLLANESEVGE